MRQDSSPHAIYDGHVMHARLKPFMHRFKYRVFSLLLDIDRLDELSNARVFSHNRWNLFSFYDRDHGAADGSSLRAYVDKVLEPHLDGPAKTIRLLCYPRVLGWVFNPLSVYYCYDNENELVALVYEVRNTFGERHTYVAPVYSEERNGEGLRQARQKRFYVSPFIEMAMRYHFRLQKPDQQLLLRILETDKDGPLLSATFSGIRKPFTASQLLQLFAAVPFQTLKIVGGIHWEALKLWLKGARYHRRPHSPKALSYGDTFEPVELSTPLAGRKS